MKRRVLWVEDSAGYELVQLIAPVITDGNYDLIIAESASDGIYQLLHNEFDAVIVDIRIPPGDNETWIRLFENSGKEKISSRLGRHFLYTILGHPDAENKLGQWRPGWIKAKKIGVMSVENYSEVENDLQELGITVYSPKCADTPETILLETIRRILKNRMG